MAATPSTELARYRIGDLVLDTGSRRVVRGQQVLDLGGLTFDFLLALAEAAPALVPYDDLANRVWDGRAVSPETIAQRAKMLRDALGDDAKSPRYFELIRGQGYRLVAGATLEPTRSDQKRPRRWFAFGAAVVVVIGLLANLVPSLDQAEVTPSVAVLPFADMSPDGDQQYFADGIAEELLNELTGLDGLHVASRTASFRFRDAQADLGQIGRTLDVGNILEGSVRKSGDDIRITVQLIDVATGYHLWSSNFDRKLDDIFAIQQDIAASVAGALGVNLGVGGVNEFTGAGTRNFDAYEAYLRGDYARAVEIDSNYAPAWASYGVSIANEMVTTLPHEAPAIIADARQHIERAIELDPQSGWAHAEFGRLISHALDWKRSEESYAKALSLRRDVRTLRIYADMHMRAGRVSSARELHEEADALELFPGVVNRRRIAVELSQGNYDSARQLTARQLEQSQPYMYADIALLEGSMEDLREAVDSMPRSNGTYASLYEPLYDKFESQGEVLETLRTLANDDDKVWPWKYHNIGLLAAAYGDPELAFDVLSEEISVHPMRNQVLWYPVMSDVRKLPEFKDFAAATGLLDYWRTYGWADACRPVGEDDFVCE